MRFDFVPKVTHNEDAARAYERQESLRIRRWVGRITLLGIPVVVLLVWLFFRAR